MREAVCSSLIEGIMTSVQDVFMRYAGLAAGGGARAAEACGCADAIVQCCAPAPKPMGRHDIMRAHAIIMGGNPSMTPGKFRTAQNWIGPMGTGMDGATYVPPDPRLIGGLVSDLEAFMAKDQRPMPISVKCAILTTVRVNPPVH